MNVHRNEHLEDEKGTQCDHDLTQFELEKYLVLWANCSIWDFIISDSVFF